MAKIGYLFCFKNYKTQEEDAEWMREFGCDTIVSEDGAQEKLRPQWRQMLSRLRQGDTIVVSKLSHALRGIRELGAFLDLCSLYKVRVVSIHDGIDSEGSLFPDTTAGDVLTAIGRLSAEVTSLRRSEARVMRLRKGLRPKTLKAGLRMDREKTIVNMYNANFPIDEIWKVSGYKSKTSIFRVLNRNGVALNRGRHQGPHRKRGDKE